MESPWMTINPQTLPTFQNQAFIRHVEHAGLTGELNPRVSSASVLRAHNRVMERLALRTAAVGPRGGNRSDTGTFGVKDLRRSGSKRRRKADRAPGSEDGVLVKLCVEQTVHLRADADLAAVAREAGDLPAPVPRFAEIMPKKIQ